jgi:tetratricopeptide (TPR) repeat protein
MRARTIWLAAGGIVAVVVAVLVIPQTRSALFGAQSNDDLIATCDSGEEKDALAACTAILESGPDENLRGAVLEERGKIYSNLDQHELALKDFQECVRLSDSARCHFGLAGEYTFLNDIDHAIAEYDEVIKREPKDGFAYMFRSGLKDKKGDLAGAAADKAAAEQFSPVPIPVPVAE